eukprot:scaffold5065_cov16-Prasinocladus_malaysianus.AAC.1
MGRLVASRHLLCSHLTAQNEPKAKVRMDRTFLLLWSVSTCEALPEKDLRFYANMARMFRLLMDTIPGGQPTQDYRALAGEWKPKPALAYARLIIGGLKLSVLWSELNCNSICQLANQPYSQSVGQPASQSAVQ